MMDQVTLPAGVDADPDGQMSMAHRRIADLEAMLAAERELRAKAEAEAEMAAGAQRDCQLDAARATAARLDAIEALIEALQPIAAYATDEARAMGLVPVSLPLPVITRADALVRLYRGMRG